MAYVPIPYPSVSYSAAGVPQPVANAAAQAALPAGYASAPTMAAAVVVSALDPLQVISTADALAPSTIVSLVGLLDNSGLPLVVEASGPTAPPLNG